MTQNIAGYICYCGSPIIAMTQNIAGYMCYNVIVVALLLQ